MSFRCFRFGVGRLHRWQFIKDELTTVYYRKSLIAFSLVFILKQTCSWSVTETEKGNLHSVINVLREERQVWRDDCLETVTLVWKSQQLKPACKIWTACARTLTEVTASRLIILWAAFLLVLINAPELRCRLFVNNDFCNRDTMCEFKWNFLISILQGCKG